MLAHAIVLAHVMVLACVLLLARTAYNTQHIDLCCVTLAIFSFAVRIFLRWETMFILASMTEFSFAPRNVSVQCSTGLVWVGCRALTFQQLPVTTELPITDKLSVPTSMNVYSASVFSTKPRGMERHRRRSVYRDSFKFY